MANHNHSRKGYVYILSNDYMPGLVKVGQSIHGGRKRAVELFSTGVPCPFSLEMEVMSQDAVELELEVHDELSHCRVEGNREFFRVDLDSAIDTLTSCWLRERGWSMVPAECEIDESFLYCLSDAARVQMGVDISPADVYALLMESASCDDLVRMKEDRDRRLSRNRNVVHGSFREEARH